MKYLKGTKVRIKKGAPAHVGRIGTIKYYKKFPTNQIAVLVDKDESVFGCDIRFLTR